MAHVAMEELMKRVGSRYKLVLLASVRTMELSDGKPKLVDGPMEGKLAMIALREIAEDKIRYREKEIEKPKE